jgi:hypothetical protein
MVESVAIKEVSNGSFRLERGTTVGASWTEIYQFAHIVTIFWCIITIFWCLHWQMQPWCKYFSIFGAESLF